MVGVMDQRLTDSYALYCGDSAEVLAGIETGSVDLITTSPPFAQLYTYSNSERDLGNSRTDAEFFAHFDFIIRELLRVTAPGRVAAIHVMDIPAMLVRDGYIGLKDFSGDVLRAFIAAGWTFDGRVPIDKNQQAQSIRTHSKALTKSQWSKDRSWLRPALPDYILKFRKPGDNIKPVVGGMTFEEWIDWANPTWPGGKPVEATYRQIMEWLERRTEEYAVLQGYTPTIDDLPLVATHGIAERYLMDVVDRAADAGAFSTWYGISESDTLNVNESRTPEQEKHICPLQLGTIERCIRLWSNPGDVVLDPFVGIGSVAVEAVKLRRKAIGVELKPEWWRVAVKNVNRAIDESRTPDLFSGLEALGAGED